jgi:glycosyltransferase involved in cell wall biosynthesis
MAAHPVVSLIVAARNEEGFIGRCLDSIVATTYPRDRLEVLVVDGMSEDRTREIVEDYAARHPCIRLLDNPKKHATAAFNAGITAARGEILMILGAHAAYAPWYVERCVRTLLRSGADNVGGIWRIVPRDGTLVGLAIALASASAFGSGDAYTKRGIRGPRLVDTVFGGCYRREVFERIGLFDERLARSQDFDFNLRLRRAGGKIVMDPEIICTYFVRSTLPEFWRHNLDDGFWTFYPLRYGRRTFTLRHVVPLVFVVGLGGAALLAPFSRPLGAAALGVLGAYIVATVGASAAIAVRHRRIGLLAALPVVFAARHVGHGIGALGGLFRAAASADVWRGVRTARG